MNLNLTRLYIIFFCCRCCRKINMLGCNQTIHNLGSIITPRTHLNRQVMNDVWAPETRLSNCLAWGGSVQHHGFYLNPLTGTAPVSVGSPVIRGRSPLTVHASIQLSKLVQHAKELPHHLREGIWTDGCVCIWKPLNLGALEQRETLTQKHVLFITIHW